MVVFDDIYPLDYVYIKIVDDERILSVPLCEIMEGTIESIDEMYNTIFRINTKKVRLTKQEYIQFVSGVLNLPIIDIRLQPAGESLRNDVKEFLKLL